MTSATLSAAGLAARTPAARDRYVDLLRVVSLGVVIAGHWLMAVPEAGGDRITNVLAVVPVLRPLTWLLQVMPLFFLVGGFAHATALASLDRRGGGYADFARSRISRLLRPAAVFLGVWLAVALGAALAGQDHGIVRVALRTVVQPLWFLGVYLALVALAPVMLRLHRRFGGRVPVALLAAAAVVDLLRFQGTPDRPSSTCSSSGPPCTSWVSCTRTAPSSGTAPRSRAAGWRRCCCSRPWGRTRCPWWAYPGNRCPTCRRRRWRSPPTPSGSPGWPCCCAARRPAGWTAPGSGAAWWRPTAWR
ncbi:hypothetical protein Asp14428_80300 [Actinoplanes sp. NBRC 14428]|nr:hypothetical protein Asp14428_80300 [Actinoplanes sp. NBRC 14428]